MTNLFKDDRQLWQATEDSYPAAQQIARVPASPLCSEAWVIFFFSLLKGGSKLWENTFMAK